MPRKTSGRRGTALLAGLAALAAGCAGDAPASGPASCPSAPDPAALAATAETEVAPGDAARGAALFQRECVRCHSAELAERGSRFFRAYPRLDCDAYLAAATPGYLHTTIAKGGEAVGRDPAMKPFEEALSAREIADLVAFLRAGP